MAGAGNSVELNFKALEEELLSLFRGGVDVSLSEEAFSDLALRVFRFQCRANPLYGSFVERRGLSPGALRTWREIPALPTRAFKSAPLVSGSVKDVEVVFRTSGTTRGRARRGEHHVRSLELYRASLTPNLRAHLLPEGRALPVLALLPSPLDAPDSSLSFMVGEAASWWWEEAGGTAEWSRTFFVDPESGIREEAFRDALHEAGEEGRPVLLAGTAFAFAQWLLVARKSAWQVTLPAGSRIMETGGFKGRTRALSREELYGGMEEVFGIPQGRIVNEYGMTELLSQFYEPVLAWGNAVERRGTKEGDGDDGFLRVHRPPPWVRTLALHPMTLEPVSDGASGILAHLDLANLGSVVRVLTEDLGTMVPGGFVLAGRSPGAEPRGCSLAMEDFLRAVERD